jgi:hypothetical protein
MKTAKPLFFFPYICNFVSYLIVNEDSASFSSSKGIPVLA